MARPLLPSPEHNLGHPNVSIADHGRFGRQRRQARLVSTKVGLDLGKRQNVVGGGLLVCLLRPYIQKLQGFNFFYRGECWF